MTKIPAVNGIYELECDSNGAYHEIVAKLIGTFAAKTSYEPNVAQTGPLYSYVAANTAKAHVKEG